MSTAAEAPRRGVPRVTRDDLDTKVSPLELFFDLVFVFALTQVTAFMADEPTFASMGRALLILALVWWAWSGYTWLTNVVDPEQVLARLVMFAAMIAMFVVALAVPTAFTENGVAFGLGYIAVRLLHAALFGVAARGEGDTALLRNVGFLVLSIVPGGGLIILGAVAFEGTTRDVLWILAVLLDYGIVVGLADASGWRVHAEHFAERFGLVMIIAFGESIVAIGIGAEDIAIDTLELVSAGLGIAVVCLLWWAYFDVVAIVAEQRFREATGLRQILIARNSYALLHLPMVSGVVLFALGMKKVLEHPEDPLKGMPAVALCGGLALYLVAHIAFRRYNTGTWSTTRPVAALACLAVIPLALEAPAIVAVAVLTAIWVTLIAVETVRYREARARIRAATHH